MQTIDTYVKESYLRLLVQGPPGTGKTTLACHLPKVYIADCDLNLAGPLRWLRENNGPMPVGYDIIDREHENGVEVDPSRCQGHTLCAMIAPDSFELDDVDGHAHAVVDDVPAEHRDQVFEAAQSCPEQATTVMVEQLAQARAAHGRRGTMT